MDERTELTKALVRAGLRSGLAGPAHGMRPEKGRGDNLPRQFQGGNVNADRGGETVGINYGPHMGTAMAQMAMRHGARVVSTAPWLMIIDGGA